MRENHHGRDADAGANTAPEKAPEKEGGTSSEANAPPDNLGSTSPAAPPDDGSSEKEGGTRTAPSSAGTDAKEEGKPRIRWADAWREAQGIIWSRRGRLLVGLVLMLLSRVAGLALPTSTKVLFDNVLGRGDFALSGPLAQWNGPLNALDPVQLLTALALAIGTATVIQSSTSFLLAQMLGVTAQRTIADMRRRVQEHVTRLPTRYFDSTKSGVLISRIMTDAEGIRNLVGNGLVQLAGSLLTASFALVALFWINWKLTVIILAVLLVFVAVMAYLFRYLRPLFRERGKINAEVTGRLGETLGGIRIVKVYTAEKREERIFAHGVHRLLRNVASTITTVSGFTSFSSLLFGGVSVLMMVVGGRAILAGQMTIGDLVMYVAFTAMVAAPAMQITSIGTQISEAFAGLDRIRELLRETTEDADDAHRRPLEQVRGDVTFERVSFEYDAGTPVLRDVSFTAPAGTTTALVGSSGSGKSTLISLVTAFNRPGRGRVRVDGHDLSELRLRDYRRHLGVVLQDSFLFDGTIAENIAYSRPHAAREEVERAGQIAYCEEFVSGFEKGYDTVIGERGVKLSGGQRQRLAIARAVLADPQLLILDEATSSLDSESEGMIQEALARLKRGRTTFVIAHRLSTIQSADQILVLEDGRIVERGTHTELLAAAGRYRELYDRQHRLETNRFLNPGEEMTGAEDQEERERASSPGRAPSLMRPE